MPQLVHTLKSLSSVALLAVSQLCTTRSKRSGRSEPCHDPNLRAGDQFQLAGFRISGPLSAAPADLAFGSKRFGKATVRKLSLSLRSRATSAAVPLALEVNRLRGFLRADCLE